MLLVYLVSDVRDAAHRGESLSGVYARELQRVIAHLPDLSAVGVYAVPDDADDELRAAWLGPYDVVTHRGYAYGPLDARGCRPDARGARVSLKRVSGLRGEVFWVPYWPELGPEFGTEQE